MSQNSRNRSMDRRAFLGASAKAALGLAGVCGLGLGLHDPIGPSASSPRAGVELPDYAAPNTKGRMAIAKGANRARLLEAALKALGGLGDFVKPGETVLIKPNAAFASPAVHRGHQQSRASGRPDTAMPGRRSGPGAGKRQPHPGPGGLLPLLRPGPSLPGGKGRADPARCAGVQAFHPARRTPFEIMAAFVRALAAGRPG